jgi:hypothetical protein
MRPNRLLLWVGLALLVSVSLVAAAPAPEAGKAPAAAGTPLKFDVYGGYFVSNKFETDSPASFVVITDPKRFDEVFGAAYVMGDRSHRLPAGAFEELTVIAPVKRGKALVEFKVQDVRLEGGVVTLRYTATAGPQDMATYACPLIVSIPKGDYKAVRFIENDQEVKRVDLAKSPEKLASEVDDKTKIAALETRLADSQAQLADKEAQIASLKAQVAALQVSFEGLKKTLQVQSDEMRQTTLQRDAALKDRSTVTDAAQQQLQKTLQAKDDTIRALQDQIKALQDRIRELQ